MPNNLQRARALAFHRQSGLCCYCGFPIWLKGCLDFAARYGLTSKQAKILQCTAEHVIAKCEGGSNCAANIGAACLFCNTGRHRRLFAPDAPTFAGIVRKRMLAKRWHNAALHALLPLPEFLFAKS